MPRLGSDEHVFNHVFMSKTSNYWIVRLKSWESRRYNTEEMWYKTLRVSTRERKEEGRNVLTEERRKQLNELLKSKNGSDDNVRL